MSTAFDKSHNIFIKASYIEMVAEIGLEPTTLRV